MDLNQSIFRVVYIMVLYLRICLNFKLYDLNLPHFTIVLQGCNSRYFMIRYI